MIENITQVVLDYLINCKITFYGYNISTLFISWFIVYFQPLQDWFDRYIVNETLREVLQCIKCMTFWTTLILTGNIVLAMALSMIAYTWQKIINNMKTFI